jgi:polysaccharide biosynthesis protein PelA
VKKGWMTFVNVWRALIVIVALAAQGLRAHAVEIEFNGGPVRREIIALYDSRRELTPQTSRIHQFVEMPLNWLGLSLTYVDVNGTLPAPEHLSKYRGIVTWFIEPLAVADQYVMWLDTATAMGLKLVVFSDLAPGTSAAVDRVSARIHARLGLETTTDYISVTHKLKLTVATPEILGFERPVDKALPDFRVLHLIDPKTTAHVTAQPTSRPDDPPSVLIATGPGGGYVSDEYSIVFDANTDRVRWTLNPFLFLKLALVKERMPVPDVTTLSGRRIYFSHIDGDGWNNVSQIDGYRQAQALSADVIRKEAIEAYPDLPVTVAVIAGDMLPELGGSALGREAAKRIYALPQVEIGSHTYTHPFDWGFFEPYSRTAEEALIDKVRAPELPTLQRARRLLYSLAGQAAPVDLAGRYVAGSSDLPRTYLKESFDLNREVAGALALNDSLAPPGKKTMLYQWSGNCLPFEAAIKATRASGIRNMNGGDSRLDAEFPSVFYVPPISKPVGTQRQIYSGNSNENTYTNDWTGPFYGFALLSETVRNTETPRRLKPFNLYYHMYSGERDSALAAIRANLNLARSSSLTPVPTSLYAAIADDFFGVAISQLDANTWAVQNRGELQTVRFDDADSVALDPLKSRGVLGSTRHASGAIYVSLDPAVEQASITLAPISQPAPVVTAAPISQASQPPIAQDLAQPGGNALPVPPQLISARWRFRNMEPSDCGFAITAQGFGPGDMLWQTAPGRKFDVVADLDGTEVTRLQAAADPAGILQLTVKADAIKPLRLRFACHDK